MFRRNNSAGFFKKGFSVIVLRLLGMILSFGLLILITNLFAEDVVGKYQYFNSLIIVGGTIALLGLNVSFIRFAGELWADQNYSEIKKLYFRNIWILTVMTLLFTALYFALRPLLMPQYISGQDDRIYQLALLALFPNCWSILNFQVLLSLRKLFLSELFRNVIKFGMSILFVAIFYLAEQSTALIEAFVVALWVVAIGTAFFVWREMRHLPKTDGQKEFPSVNYRKILKVSVPMTLSFLSLLLMQQLDLLLLKEYSPYESLAYYGVAVKISMTLSIVLTAVNQVIGPQVAELFYKNDREGLKHIIDKSIVLNNVLTIPIILLVLLIPDFVLRIFGENYTAAKIPLMILLAGQALNALMGSTDLYLNMTGKQNFFQKIMLLALVVNLILNLILIPPYGMTGAAVATAVSLILWNILGVIHVYRKDGIVLIFNFALIKKYLQKK